MADKRVQNLHHVVLHGTVSRYIMSYTIASAEQKLN